MYQLVLLFQQITELKYVKNIRDGKNGSCQDIMTKQHQTNLKPTLPALLPI